MPDGYMCLPSTRLASHPCKICIIRLVHPQARLKCIVLAAGDFTNGSIPSVRRALYDLQHGGTRLVDVCTMCVLHQQCLEAVGFVSDRKNLGPWGRRGRETSGTTRPVMEKEAGLL